MQRDGFKTAVFAINPMDKDKKPAVSEKKCPAVKAEPAPAPAEKDAAPVYDEDSGTLDRLKELVAKQYHIDAGELTAASQL